MGFADLLMFYLVTGISLRWIATAAHAGPSAIVIWIGAWLCFYVPLALSVVELSSRYPRKAALCLEQACLRRLCRLHRRLELLDQQSALFSCGPLFRSQQCSVHARAEVDAPLGPVPAYYVVFALGRWPPLTLMQLWSVSNMGKWLHNVGAFAMWIPAVIVIVMGVRSRWHRFGSATVFTASH